MDSVNVLMDKRQNDEAIAAMSVSNQICRDRVAFMLIVNEITSKLIGSKKPCIPIKMYIQ